MRSNGAIAEPGVARRCEFAAQTREVSMFVNKLSERRTPKFLLSISIQISKICPLKRRASIIFLMLDLDYENPNAH